MRCPKCHYISFDTSDRCRNCGYDFSLADAPAPSPELPIRGEGDPIGPLADLTLHGARPERAEPAARAAPPGSGPLSSAAPSGDLPLFAQADAAFDDRPLVASAARPRPPLAVRRPTPDVARSRARASRPRMEEAPILDLGPAPAPAADAPPASAPVAVERPRVEELAPAGRVARLAAGATDGAILIAIDALVLYFTLRLCGLTFPEISTLPLAPLFGFFLVLNGGYLVAFTAAGGQTIGKMAAGIRIVGELGRPVGVGQALFRTAAYFVSVLPLGLGFLPALLGEPRRALHDRLAETRVVKA